MTYKNLAKKLGRDFSCDHHYRLTLDHLTHLFVRYLYGERVHLYTFENYLSQLGDSNLIFYKEISELYNQCYLFLIKKKSLQLNVFKDFPKYNYLLSEETQFIIIYTLSQYYYHVYNDISLIQKMIQLPHSNNEYIKKIIHDLSFYYDLNQTQIPTKYKIDHSDLVKVFEIQGINISIQLNYNEWINASIYAKLGLFATINNHHQLAFSYFQKALDIHPLILLHYLPAYYMVVKKTQPSLLRFNHLLEKMKDYDDCLEAIQLFKMILEGNKKLRPYIRKVVLPKLINCPYSIHSHYNLLFYNKLLLKKM